MITGEAENWRFSVLLDGCLLIAFAMHRPSNCIVATDIVGCDVAERLDCSPPHQGEPNSISDRVTPDSRKWESSRTMPLVGGFAQGSSVPATIPFYAAPFSPHFTLIVSQYLVVKIRPNLSTQNLWLEEIFRKKKKNALKTLCTTVQARSGPSGIFDVRCDNDGAVRRGRGGNPHAVTISAILPALKFPPRKFPEPQLLNQGLCSNPSTLRSPLGAATGEVHCHVTKPAGLLSLGCGTVPRQPPGEVDRAGVYMYPGQDICAELRWRRIARSVQIAPHCNPHHSPTPCHEDDCAKTQFYPRSRKNTPKGVFGDLSPTPPTQSSFWRATLSESTHPRPSPSPQSAFFCWLQNSPVQVPALTVDPRSCTLLQRMSADGTHPSLDLFLVQYLDDNRPRSPSFKPVPSLPTYGVHDFTESPCVTRNGMLHLEIGNSIAHYRFIYHIVKRAQLWAVRVPTKVNRVRLPEETPPGFSRAGNMPDDATEPMSVKRSWYEAAPECELLTSDIVLYPPGPLVRLHRGVSTELYRKLVQWRVVKCFKVKLCLFTSVHSWCTQQEPVNTVLPRETECILTTLKRAARDPLDASCGSQSMFGLCDTDMTAMQSSGRDGSYKKPAVPTVVTRHTSSAFGYFSSYSPFQFCRCGREFRRGYKTFFNLRHVHRFHRLFLDASFGVEPTCTWKFLDFANSSEKLDNISNTCWEPMKLKRGKYGAAQGQGKRGIHEKTRLLATSSGTIHKCENPGSTPPVIEPGSPWWEAANIGIFSVATKLVTYYILLWCGQAIASALAWTRQQTAKESEVGKTRGRCEVMETYRTISKQDSFMTPVGHRARVLLHHAEDEQDVPADGVRAAVISVYSASTISRVSDIVCLWCCFLNGMPLTNEEAFDMLMILGEYCGKCRAAARLYAERYAQRVHHSYSFLQHLACRVCTTGLVQPTHNKRRRIRRPV
ncbi:hypothetical protein PR048_009416 [Dryococelus australis]|uniref:C2H2-type domain-containing protein n=1 Tax=Dryococelus australis TaxID=614101 RepID=A0ABQ9I0J0_9NEOP|nr:hypothetical protein PR048_009416 [Dryococelus australis]